MAEKKSDLHRVRAMLEQAHKDGDLSAEDLVKQMPLLDEKNTAEIEAYIRYQKQHGRKQKKGDMTAYVPPEKNRKDQKEKEKRVLPRSREDESFHADRSIRETECLRNAGNVSGDRTYTSI